MSVKEKIIHNRRKWLRSQGNACISVVLERSIMGTNNTTWYYGAVEISDSTSKVYLPLDIDTKAERARTRKMLDTIINELEAVANSIEEELGE